MTGWRLGYVVAGEQIARALEKQQELCVSCAPSVSQKAAEAALSLDHGYINKMVIQYRNRRDIALKILKQHGLYRYTPQGAFYLLLDISATRMDPNSFADRLLEEKRVAVAPGATFGPLAEMYIRISLATEEHVLVEGLEKTCNFINRINI
jgi:aspartate aminotransferase/aminotransferase